MRKLVAYPWQEKANQEGWHARNRWLSSGHLRDTRVADLRDWRLGVAKRALPLRVSLHMTDAQTESVALVPVGAPATPANNRGVDRRWTPLLAKKFCPVSSIFLEHYHELQPRPGVRGMNSTEAMLVIQLLDFKWDDRAPFPTVKKIAQRMGLSQRMVRGALKSLEDGGYIRRDPMSDGGPNRYYFDGLFKALEQFVETKAQEAA